MIYMSHKGNIIMTRSGNKLISHRGNINGRTEHENDPTYIKDALDSGYNVEIDVSFSNNSFWLGHDDGRHKVEIDFLQNKKLWCHLKNKESLKEIVSINARMQLSEDKVHYFWHTNEDLVITSYGYIWHHSRSATTDFTLKSIAVLPELMHHGTDFTNKCYGICSDVIKKYNV